MRMIFHEFRYAVRVLFKTPLSTAVAILSLALGIGANTAIFSLINALVIKPLAVPSPQQLVTIETSGSGSYDGRDRPTLAMVDRFRKSQTVFSGMFLWDGGGMSNFEAKGANFAGGLDIVSGDYFPTLGVRPVLGRLIGPADVNLRSDSSAQVAVLDYRCWKLRYHGDPNVIGQVLRVEGRPLTVIGVTPESFHGILMEVAPEAIAPIGFAGTGEAVDAASTSFDLMARLKPGISVNQARSQLAAMWPAIRAASMPVSYGGAQRTEFLSRRILVERGATGSSWVRERLTGPLRMLMGLVVTVLVIGCVNLANLMLARSSARRHELGIRRALGAGTGSLARQSLLESLILAGAGSLLGLGVAVWAARALVSTFWTGIAPTAINPDPDWRVLLFEGALGIATGILFGLAPIFALRNADPSTSMGSNPRNVHGGTRWAGRLLVSMQVALSLVMVVGAVLFVRSLGNIYGADPGFNREGVLLAKTFPLPGVRDTANRSAYYRDVAQKLRNIPGVQAASYSKSGPITQFETKESVMTRFGIKADGVSEVTAPGFFDVMRMHVLAGREFLWSDDENSRRVVVISQSLADRLFPSGKAIGQTVKIGVSPDRQSVEVIGVVNSASLWVVQNRLPMAYYLPLLQERKVSQPTLVLRVGGNPSAFVPVVASTLRSMGRQYALTAGPLTSRLDKILVNERLVAGLSTFLGLLALILAGLGLYGLLSYNVSLRVPEIAVRIALGAQRGTVVRMILGQAIVTASIGIVAGLVIALVASRLVSGMLFGLSPNDPVSIALAAGALLAAAALAGYWPALRASSLDPMKALRSE